MKIFCRDENEKNNLKQKYPDVDAQFELIPEGREFSGPLICDDDEPLDTCLVGEHHIKEIFKN